MSVISSSLPEKARTITGEALQAALVDLVDLSLLAKQAHWNLVGPRFRSVHLQLDEVVVTAREHTDIVAERAATIGVSPDGRATAIAEDSRVPQLPAGWVRDTDVVDKFVEILQAVTERMRGHVEATAEADPISQDLLIDATAALEKHAWMFQAERAD